MNLEEVKATRIIIQDKISSNEDPMVRVIEELDQDDLPKKNPFVRGSDPRVATCRGRLQNKRCQLNQEINKELRLRAGAENLFKATTNRKLRENVALELSFVNSNLQLLKEQLAELNSSVELYQKDSKECVMPMIPLGLKETKDVEFREPFKDFILEHYSEDAAAHDDAISDFMDMRQAIRTPVRTATGVSLLFRYYNQLYFVERRFFPPDRSLGIYFEWFDSLTGVPSCQRTVAFEKACVLFNMAAIYTQIGAKQERRSARGLDGAVDALLRAAGTLRYIHENFTNAPSVDLSAPALDVLVDLMMAQARECLLEKLSLQAAEECAARDLELCDDLHLCLDLCHECAQLSTCYADLYQKMQSESVFHYVPYSWVSLVHVKTEFYKGLAHHHCATGLLSAGGGGGGVAEERLCGVGGRSVDGVTAGGEVGGEVDRPALGRAHLREALALYEEALRLQRMCRELRGKGALSSVLRSRQQRAARDCATALGDGPDFTEILDPPQVQPSSKFQLSLTPPDFAQHRVEDLFRALGPLAVFSAKRHWSAPRLVQLHRYTSSVTRGARRREEVVRPPRRDRSEDNGIYYVNGRSHTQENGDKDASSRKSKLMYSDIYTNNNNSDVGYDSGEREEEETGEKTGDRSELVVSAVAGVGSCARALRRAASDASVSRGSETDDGFGFSVRGDAPVVVASVEPGSLADLGGVRAGDLVVGVCGRDARWSRHEEVVRLVRRARARGLALTLKLVTPRESATRHQESSPRPLAPTPVSAGGSMSASSASSGGSARARAWNPFRRHTPTRALTHNDLSNVIFSKECVMPMIPLGLKETKDVEFREPFKDFILEHYSEDAAAHDDAISDFMDMRQAIRTPVRTATGVSLLFRYYNQLYFVERRFFPPDRSLGIYFEWFDSLTGVPSCQRTVAFEKACVLFNMAAIYTQIGAKQERRSARGLDGAVDALLRAAGTLRYIHENFTNAPSVDLSAPALDVLVDLMMAQARECLLEKLSLQAAEECAARDLELCDDLHLCLDLCHECAQLSTCYADLYQKMQSESVFHYVPYSWVSLVHVKTEFYKGLAHHHCATGLLSAGGGGGGVAEERLCGVGGRSVDGVTAGGEVGGEVDRPALGRAHLREALALYEEALRLQRMCRELRGKGALSSVLRSQQQRAARDCATALGDGPDFTEILDPPQVQPSSKFQLSLTPPDFAQHRVEDLFRALGPLAVFSAKRHWSAPRLVQLHRYTSSVTRGARRREEVVRPPRRDRSEDNGIYYVNGRSHTQENGDKDASSRKSKLMYSDIYTNNNNSDVGYDSGEREEEETGEKTGDRSELVVSAVAGVGSCARALRRAASDASVSRGSETDDGFGFSVRGDAPVVVASVEPGSLADLGGVRAGDLVVGVCGRDARWSRHEEVVRLVRRARARGLALTLKLVTPRESATRHQESSPRPLAPTPVSAGGSMSASSASSGGSARARAWNPFRRHTPTRALTHNDLSNVIFR